MRTYKPGHLAMLFWLLLIVAANVGNARDRFDRWRARR